MIRETSIEVYHQIKKEGLLQRMNWQVYSAIYQRGNCTIREIAEWDFPQINDRSISPHFNILRRRGVIREVGKRSCKISGRMVLSWVTTKSLPEKYFKPKKEKCKHCKGSGYEPEMDFF